MERCRINHMLENKANFKKCLWTNTIYPGYLIEDSIRRFYPSNRSSNGGFSYSSTSIINPKNGSFYEPHPSPRLPSPPSPSPKLHDSGFFLKQRKNIHTLGYFPCGMKMGVRAHVTHFLRVEINQPWPCPCFLYRRVSWLGPCGLEWGREPRNLPAL